MTCLPFVVFVPLVAKKLSDSFLAQSRSGAEEDPGMCA